MSKKSKREGQNGPDVSEEKIQTIQGYGDHGDAEVNPAVVHTRDDQKRQTEGVREAQMAKSDKKQQDQQKSAEETRVDRKAQAIPPVLGQADALTAPDGRQRHSAVSIAPRHAGQSTAIPLIEKAEQKVGTVDPETGKKQGDAAASEEPPPDFMPGFTEPESK
jgi:hypothetical protein